MDGAPIQYEGLRELSLFLLLKGAFCRTKERSLFQPGFSIPVVDTTGAGDVFHGAFMVGLLENWSLEKILEFSAAVAAMKCRGLGGRVPIPTRQEAMAFLEARGTPQFWMPQTHWRIRRPNPIEPRTLAIENLPNRIGVEPYRSSTLSWVSAFFQAASNSCWTSWAAYVFLCAFRLSSRPKSERPFRRFLSRSARNTFSASP